MLWIDKVVTERFHVSFLNETALTGINSSSSKRGSYYPCLKYRKTVQWILRCYFHHFISCITRYCPGISDDIEKRLPLLDWYKKTFEIKVLLSKLGYKRKYLEFISTCGNRLFSQQKTIKLKNFGWSIVIGLQNWRLKHGYQNSFPSLSYGLP